MGTPTSPGPIHPKGLVQVGSGPVPIVSQRLRAIHLGVEDGTDFAVAEYTAGGSEHRLE